jgi:RimJ/RimL family protein N-acetyltransferase
MSGPAFGDSVERSFVGAWQSHAVANPSHFEPMRRELNTDRLLLRPWRPSDAETHRQLWTERDRRSLRLIDEDGRPTVDDLRERMAAQSAGATTGLRLYAVERLTYDDFVGYCGLIVGAADVDEPEIAFEFTRSQHGNGYATEAATIVVAEAVSTGRKRLWATVREWNTSSFRVLDKVGFRHSGRVTSDRDRGDTVWMTMDLAADP